MKHPRRPKAPNPREVIDWVETALASAKLAKSRATSVAADLDGIYDSAKSIVEQVRASLEREPNLDDCVTLMIEIQTDLAHAKHHWDELTSQRTFKFLNELETL